MYCSQCGTQVEKDSRYCPSCGAKLSELGTSLKASQTEIIEKAAQKKPMPLWFKILSILAVLALIGVTAGILFTESLVDVVDHQLGALKNEDISQAYYRYTSKDFQGTTSLEQFQEFIRAYPIFLNAQSANFTQRSIKHQIGILKGNLTAPDHSKTPIEYKLVKEDGKWKILSIRLLQPGMLQAPKESVKPQELINIIKAQLSDLENHKLSEAYQKYSSDDFKDATSQETFEEFIKKYPILTKHTSVSFHKPSTKDGISSIAVILKSHERAAYLKYYFIYENQAWKIWSMRILSPSEQSKETDEEEKESILTESSQEPMSLSEIELGSQIDKNGIIITPKVAFESDTNHIYVNVDVDNGLKDEPIYLNFQHLESGSFVPGKATIEENGDTTLMSVFSAPEGGWPVGHYKLVVTSSKGLNKVLDFEIH